MLKNNKKQLIMQKKLKFIVFLKINLENLKITFQNIFKMQRNLNF